MPKQYHQSKIARCEGNLPWVSSSRRWAPNQNPNDLQFVPQPHHHIKMLPLANVTQTQTKIKGDWTLEMITHHEVGD